MAMTAAKNGSGELRSWEFATFVNVAGELEGPRVYCQSAAIIDGLGKLDAQWQIAPLSENLGQIDYPAVVIAGNDSNLSPQLCEAVDANRARLIFLLDAERKLPEAARGMPIFAFADEPVDFSRLGRLIDGAFENLALPARQAGLEQALQRARWEIDQLNEIGVALSAERDRGALLKLILQKCREITHSDAGSLYLVEEDESGARRLRFSITQNDSLQFPFSEFFLPIDRASLAGYVALTGEEIALDDVYEIPPSLPFRFNPALDEESGYRCRSILVVPMKAPKGEITGVVQLINCKRDLGLKVDRSTVADVVLPYPDQCRPMLRSLASQAAVALDNNRLYESIENLFEGFVRASVGAIEARDPTTSGHSFRVANLTVGLAEAVDRADSAPFRDVHFSRTEMKEIRYASLLHDFGKVGVREEVLVKAKKLYPGQLELIRQRFAYARKTLEQQQSERKLTYLLEKGREDFLLRQAEFQRELETELKEIDAFLDMVVRYNEPTVLSEGNFARLGELAARHFADGSGGRQPLLAPHEVKLLSIDRGSLDDEERLQIQAHVNYTQSFLQQIPWTKDIKNIPDIASAHHEKLNGTGYPRNLAAPDIPFQSKMMTISDIYDALSATDRPYKHAVPRQRALDILYDEAKRGMIDGDLLQLFREAEIFRRATNSKHD
jgi:HD-GYP domain-containing protein (c-di-GMP phosphodiesterase class II)